MSTGISYADSTFSIYRSSSNIDQQTFLGASIRSFSANGGFGDTSATLNVDLVVDEFNVADQTTTGQGQDVYHDGQKDKFNPPPAGSPVFFTLGSKFQKVSDVFKRACDVYYKTNTVPPSSPYYNHFYFGGILQSYVETRSPQGNPLYSVQVVDPREILSNVTVMLNNYNGSAYGHYNFINVYGVLEFNDGDFQSNLSHQNAVKSSSSFNSLSSNLTETFSGNDMEGILVDFSSSTSVEDSEERLNDLQEIYGFRFSPDDADKPSFIGISSPIKPLTGTGFSRRSESGIPYYRICQAINYLFGHYGDLPDKVQEAGFFKEINFRGIKYMVDLSSLPLIPPFHYFDFDQINLLDFCLEVCDIANHELFVTLIPVINHRSISNIYNLSGDKKPEAIIKVITIDKSEPFNLSAIKNFIDDIDTEIVPVVSTDVGYELTNNVTDRIVIGANEVDSYYFSSALDRLWDIESDASWKISNTLRDTIVPYYGMIANKAVTIPAGNGSYQQILLDANGLNAYGVGRYYVATEMELRSALIKYETWVEFLMQYNDIYMEPIANGDILAPGTNASYQVTVPRCVFVPINSENGFDGSVPKNPCHPPLGYPLYWKRAKEIGIPQAGLVGSASFNMKMVEITTAIKNSSKDELKNIVDSAIEQLKAMDVSRLTAAEKNFYEELRNALIEGTYTSIIDEYQLTAHNLVSAAQTQSKKNMRNTMKIYNFLKSIADECLGKKFLVKIPQSVDTSFDITSNDKCFGFPPKKITSNPKDIDRIYSSDENYGALEVNKNPFSNKYEYNYSPEPLGGYPPYKLLNRLKTAGLLPIDTSVIRGENGRILPYAIFYESQNLDFGPISTEDYIQESVQDGQYDVDYAYSMDNSTSSSSSILNAVNNPDVSNVRSRAFIRCSLDSKFYMPPEITTDISETYYGSYNKSNVKRKPRQFTDKNTGKQKYFKLADISYHYPTTARAGSINIDKIDLNYLYADDGNLKTDGTLTEFKFNTDVVYALITLPGRLSPTVTKRYRDAKELSDKGLKHFLQLDVTHLFSNPPPAQAGSAKTAIYGSEEITGTVEFDKAVKKSTSNITYALPNQILMTAGSPVFPDVVSIPLLSKQRSYGPWMSSYKTTDIIGGNTEIIKDESLAPWNYAGYSLMDSAGSLRCSFGNSAQLTSERGTITLAGPPYGGVSLCGSLIAGGPLVSTINLDVSDRGVTTTYKMDLFTKSFGKLHQQKEKLISKISRNQQKIIDEKNALIRKNMGKNATNQTYTEIYKAMRDQAKSQAYDQSNGSEALAGRKPAGKFTISVNAKSETSEDGQDTDTRLQYASSVMDEDTARVSAETLSMNPNNNSRQYYNSVSCDLQDFMMPASLEPDHDSMSSYYNTNYKAKTQNYYDKDSFPLEKITYWR